jgi:hypothetical protein
MMAAGAGPDSPAAKALAQQQQNALSPEVQRRLAIANKKVEDYIAKGMGIEESAPEGVREEDIQHTMKLHNMTREEVLSRLKGAKK